ncbi:MAG: alcohol dehydrogenase catalytic domain-containing protein [bacterium]|nr:alcohol dehydrogenase catalytic domain-containing protein [bacterium]
MKGVVYLGESEVEVREFPEPEAGPGQVVVEMKVAGLCGSDLHKYHSSKEWAAERKGMISGHEPTGVVAEVGPGVTNVSVGDRVCVYHSLGCGHCEPCYAGTPVFCADEGAFGRTHNGSHADFMVTDARYCLPLPAELSFGVGAQLACTAGTAYGALSKVPARAGECFVVFGLGPGGLSVLVMGQAMGFNCVGVDINPYRIEQAKRLVEGTILDGKALDPVEVVKDLTGGRGASGVVECSGSGVARRQAPAVAGLHATVVYVGAGAKEITMNPLDVMRKELTIRGNAVYSMGAYFEAVRFLQANSIQMDDLVTHRFQIDEAVEAFRVFDGGETGKAVFEWGT